MGAVQGRVLRYTRSSVGHWLRGSRPRAPVPGLVALAFSRRLGRPVAAEETGLSRLSASQAAAAPGGTVGPGALDHLLLLARGDVDPARRALLRRLPYVPLRDAGARWAAQAPALPRTGTGTSAGQADADVLRDMIRNVDRLAAGHGGAHARTAVAAYLADDACPLLIHRAARPVRRELFLRTAQLAHLLALMTDDAGHHELARRYFGTALGLARQAGHRPTFAITLRALSLQALCLGHPREAHELAGRAVETAGAHASGAVRSFVLIQRARTAALDGQRRPALDLMEAAVRRHDLPADPSDPFARYPTAGLHYQRAAVLSALGRHGDAVAALEASAEHRAERERAPGALTYARLAETHLRLGHLDAACTNWQHFLARYPRLRSCRAEHALAELRRSLRPYGFDPRARTVLEQAHALGPEPG